MVPTRTEVELRVAPTDKWYERCLKLAARVDWRGLALVLAALAGIGGAVWNKLDSIVEKTLTARTQQGVYEVLASKLDDMSARIESLETSHGIKPKPPAAPDKSGPDNETGRAPTPISDAAMAAVVTVDAGGPIAPAEPTFNAAQLPSFRAIQQKAKDNELPLLRREIRSVAVSAE